MQHRALVLVQVARRPVDHAYRADALAAIAESYLAGSGSSPTSETESLNTCRATTAQVASAGSGHTWHPPAGKPRQPLMPCCLILAASYLAPPAIT